jgi:hypothetical protein
MVQEEQLNTFIFQLSLKKICSLRIQRIRQMAKKVIKYSISWLIIKLHEKNFRSSLSMLDRFD